MGFLIWIFLLHSACKGQVQTTHNEVVGKDSVKKQDVDPYFMDTKTITSPFGPKSITRNIIQDKKGNLWFASWEGIIRYDGKVFTNFTLQNNLRKYHTFSAFEDSKGNLWFGAIRGGVYRYDGQTFTNFTQKEGLSDWVECMIEDKKGNIWFATNEGIVCFDGIKFQTFTTKEGLIDDYVHCLLETQNGEIWVATGGGISIYDGKSFRNFNQTIVKPFHNIRTLIQDQKGTIWIGGQEGLFSYDGISINTHSTKFAGYLYEDKKGNIWLASFESEGKMALLKKELKGDFEEIKKENGQVFGILEDKEGNIWFGREEGITRYDPSAALKTGNNAFTTFTE
ncbi:MAG: two-component regulator propeller domain-containing protein [Bacteroidia bacterium]